MTKSVSLSDARSLAAASSLCLFWLNFGGDQKFGSRKKKGRRGVPVFPRKINNYSS